MQIALKIDVDTWRGTREGVPRLAGLLERHGAGATFLFSLGPDHTGRAIRRALRPGFMKKVSRTSVLEHYGLRTLLYGTLLPGPDIGMREAALLRSVRERGFETGVHTWDHVKWQDGVMHASNDWTRTQMRLALDRYERVFGEPASVHGAAGWQTNRAAIRFTQQFGCAYASDTRGTDPFMPVWDAEVTRCPQMPTTLPTLDEMIGLDGTTPDNVAERLLERTGAARRPLEVYTLHAELEGMKLAPAFERLLAGWRAQGYTLVAMRDALATLDVAHLPHHVVEWGTVPGRSGLVAVQGRRFLGEPAPGPLDERRATAAPAGA